MCIAIVKFKSNPISEDNLYRGYLANRDGCGFAYVDEHGNIQMEKAMVWDEFIPLYRVAVAKYGDTSDFLIHFRITSKGAITLDNCHPFRINDDMVLIHNGTITSIPMAKDEVDSDTKIFAEQWLSTFGEAFLYNKYLWFMIEDFIGWSKICILHRTKGVFILNKNKGEFGDDGNWYSNSGYKPVVPVKYTPKTYTEKYEDDWAYYNQRYSSSTPAPKKEYTPNYLMCDFCKTLTDEYDLVTVEDSDGTQMELCDVCYNYDYVKDDKTCSICEMSHCTETYIVKVWGDEEYVLCESCFHGMYLEEDTYTIKGKEKQEWEPRDWARGSVY